MHHSEQAVNRLIHETSPYLLQHASNPVDWYPWSDEAFEAARESDRLVLVSIGYAACHWCHVMEKESFSDPGIAGFMNGKFICIKVDREERPDVDQVYMDALQMLTGSGGWPLNIFVLPDKRPVYGGTYFRPADWKNLLDSLARTYREEKERVLAFAGDLARGIREASLVTGLPPAGNDIPAELPEEYLEARLPGFDPVNGGLAGAPKFPLPVGLDYLLHHDYYFQDPRARDHLLLSLKKMALGGIYDQLGGGFARYSVDEGWKVPHFEKMLSDNAQLLDLYALSFLHLPAEWLRRIVRETAAFLLREMRAENGLFSSSLDADSEGEEGKYYTWSLDEISRVLGDRADRFCRYFQVSSEGNWEGKNILHAARLPEDYARENGEDPTEFIRELDTCRRELFSARQERIRPGLDTKQIVSWNALTIRSLVHAAAALADPSLLNEARYAMHALLSASLEGEDRLRRLAGKHARPVSAFLEDYSYLIDALIVLYGHTGETGWLYRARKLTLYVLAHFSHEKAPWFYFSPDTEPLLLTRKTELADGVLPSANALMARSLYMLGSYFGETAWRDRARAMLSGIRSRIAGGRGPWYASWAKLVLWLSRSPSEFVLAGNGAAERMAELSARFRPEIIPALATREDPVPLLEGRGVDGPARVYVCRNGSCDLPVQDLEEALSRAGKEAGIL